MRKLKWDFIELLVLTLIEAAACVYGMVLIKNNATDHILMYVIFYALFLFFTYVTAFIVVQLASLKDEIGE